MTDIQDRVLAKVEHAANGCWIWRGKRNDKGYAYIWIDGRLLRAHRIAYMAWRGPIPDGLTIDHTCHTSDSSCAGGNGCAHRACVNPEHLEPVTVLVNTLRGGGPPAVNARKTHCVKGHEFDLANTRFRPDQSASRCCRTCQRDRQRAARAARKKAPAA